VTGCSIDPAQLAVVLLAAGQSQRFGDEDKLLAPIGGIPLAIHSARAIYTLGAGTKVAVCPSTDGALARALAEEGFEIVVNPHPEQGLSSSLACGIGRVILSSAKAAFVCLADMPFVAPEHFLALLNRLDPVARPVIASSSEGIAMPPALFARSKFEQLMTLNGGLGARPLLTEADLVPASPKTLADVDRRSDLPESH
jgi:molybdenum cofactor cytidylyltransferase